MPEIKTNPASLGPGFNRLCTLQIAILSLFPARPKLELGPASFPYFKSMALRVMMPEAVSILTK